MKKNEEKNVNDKGFDPTFTIQSVPKSLLNLYAYAFKCIFVNKLLMILTYFPFKKYTLQLKD